MATMKTSSLLAFLFVANLLFYVIATSCTKPKNPNPNPTPATSNGKCPRDALKLGVCAKLLNGSVGTVVGTPPDLPCCSLLGGLLDLEVALCLCTALKANILGINLNIPIALSVLLNTCGNKLPPAFQC